MNNLYDCLKFNSNNILNGKVSVDFVDLKMVKEFYLKHIEKIACHFLEIGDTVEFIWRILTSTRYSIYSNRMNKNCQYQIYNSIRNKVRSNAPIQIVIAGFPGKCPNRKKVYNVTPDLGEFSVLCRLEQMNEIVTKKYKPGLEFIFLSDCLGMDKAFFPNINDIYRYINIIENWIKNYSFKASIKIMPITDIFEETHVLQMKLLEKCLREKIYDSYVNREKNKELVYKILDKMDIDEAKKYYKENYFIELDEYQIGMISTQLYLEFWNQFSYLKKFEKKFQDSIHASAVAYHPDRRLCLILQDAKSCIATWNGVGVMKEDKIISYDQRICIERGYYCLYDRNDYFWGYIDLTFPKKQG